MNNSKLSTSSYLGNVLITGGAGFLGSHLTEYLLNNGVNSIVIVDDFSLGNLNNLKDLDDIQIYRIDCKDLIALMQIIKERKIDTIINCAVSPLPMSFKFPFSCVANNVNSVMTMAEITRMNLIRKLIHISSSEIYGDAKTITMDENHPTSPTTPYAASKLSGDQILISYANTFDLNITIVRPFNLFGPKQNSKDYAAITPLLFKNYKARNPMPIFGNGLQTRDFMYVKNAAKIIGEIGMKDLFNKEIVNIGSENEISILEFVRKFFNFLGEPDYPIEFRTSRISDISRHRSDNSRLRNFLNLTPHSIQDGELAQTSEWFLRND